MRLDQRVTTNRRKDVGVSPGYRNTTVHALVTTATCEERLLIALDNEGK